MGRWINAAQDIDRVLNAEREKKSFEKRLAAQTPTVLEYSVAATRSGLALVPVHPKNFTPARRTPRTWFCMTIEVSYKEIDGVCIGEGFLHEYTTRKTTSDQQSQEEIICVKTELFGSAQGSYKEMFSSLLAQLRTHSID